MKRLCSDVVVFLYQADDKEGDKNKAKDGKKVDVVVNVKGKAESRRRHQSKSEDGWQDSGQLIRTIAFSLSFLWSWSF